MTFIYMHEFSFIHRYFRTSPSYVIFPLTFFQVLWPWSRFTVLAHAFHILNWACGHCFSKRAMDTLTITKPDLVFIHPKFGSYHSFKVLSHISKNTRHPTKYSSAVHDFRARMLSRHLVQTAQNIPLGDTLADA